MSFLLRLGTVPRDLPIKATGPFVLIGDYRVSLLDFLLMVEYVLQNTDLEPDDPRLIFIERVRKIRQGPGWMRKQRRLVMRAKPGYQTWKARPETELIAEMSAAAFGHPTARKRKKRKPAKSPGRRTKRDSKLLN